MRNRNFKDVFKKSLLLMAIVFSASTLKAQLTGVKTIPGDYATISAFVADANLVGIGAGGVVVNVAGGHTETSTAVIALTATGTAANPIVIQKSGAGANPIITSYIGGTGTPGSATQDGIFALVGSDYVTFDGINLVENAANTSNPSTMEYGFGMFKASATDGCQFNVIRNCAITLSNLNNATGSGPSFDGSRGINLTNALITAQITTVTVTDALGSNSNNQIYSNTISNVNIGIALAGFAAATPFTLGDTGNDVGGSSLLTGNTIVNFGGAAAATNPAAGIRTVNQWSPNISYNTINNNTGAGVNHVSTLRGILIGAAVSANATINNNSVTVNSGATTSLLEGISNASGSTAASNTININNNLVFVAYSTATSGNINAILNSGTAATVNINGNTVSNIASLPTLQNVIAGTGTVLFITGGSPTNLNVNTNTITTFARTSIAGGTTRGIVITTPTNTTINGNTIENIAYSNPLSTGNIDGIYSLSSAVTVTITNNIVRNLSTPTTGIINGIRENSVGGTKTITGNQVYSFATTSGGAGGGTFRGIYTTVGTITIQNNTIYNLISAGSTGGTGGSIIGVLTDGGAASILANKIYDLASNSTNPLVAGVHINGGTTNTVANNLIGNLRAPFANAANPLIGINITAGTTATVYYNTVHINGTSAGVLFGSSAISVSTTPNVTLRNNIFINESSFNGAAFAVAMRRSSTALTSYNNASNNNLFYAGAPSANNLIMYDGTNSYGTLVAYQTAVLPRDVNSITGEAPFAGLGYATVGNFFTSLTGSSSDFLRPVAGITTQVESGATAIVGVTTDFAGITRPASGTNPDMGAYEFAGVSPAPVITLNSVTPSTTSQCVAAARNVSVNVTTVSGTITAVNLGYSVNGVPQANIPMTNTSGTTWEAILPLPTPSNALIAWGVSATNSIGLNSSYTGTSYSDEPLTGVTASANASLSTVCSNDPTQLSATLNRTGTVNSGIGGGTSNAIALSPFYHAYGGAKTQYIIRASELTAMGLIAGNITSLGVNITTLGTATLNGFSISIGHTAQNAVVTNTAIASGLTQTYSNAAQVLTLGVNTYVLSAPFNWNGTSNIVVSMSYSNVNAGGTSSTVTTDPVLTFNSSMAIVADNATAACILGAVATTDACMGGTTFNSVSATRPRFTFVGNTAPAITSVTWLDGATTVGTGNPLTVNPTTTTTYSANITAAGCVFSPAPTVTVTVNPLPTAPTAVNSAQCGTQIPTASVTSTSGLLTPTFKWYDVAVAGTDSQNSTSTTYTLPVGTTTTFYVAEVNTTTGCESARTPITVTVANADGITASANNPSICIGSPVVLSVANNNGTPNQTYTYAWTNAITGSGLVSQTGSSITVTPTLPGTYTYDVVGVDGGCSAISSVIVTVNPFAATITAVNATCNAGNDGSFTLGTTTCGTAPYTYSVDGGSYGSIPTNLIAGTYSVLVKDANGYISAALPLIISQPSTTITNPTVTNASVCQNSASATVTASATTSVPASASAVVNFNVIAQPAESFAAPGNIVASATVPTLPVGAIVTSLVINYNGITPNATGEWQSDVRLGLSGAFTNANASGTGTTGSGTVIGVPFNYTRTINSPVGFPLTGGTINLMYHNDFNDATTTIDALFALGNVASLVINYTSPTPATITWWDAPTGGTQIGAGSPFETVGTSVLPSTVSAGVVTLYAQGQNGACPSPARTAATVTVNALPSVNAGGDQTVCAGTAVTLNGTVSGGTWSGPVAVTNGTAFTPPAGVHTFTYSVTNVAGCTSTDDVIVTVNALPVVNAGLDQTICLGASVTLSGTVAGGTWSGPVTIADGVAFTPPAGIHTFTYSVTNVASCTNTDDVIVTVNTLPVVNAGVDQTVCEGDAVTLSGTVAGGTWSGPVAVTNGTAFTPPAGIHTFTYSVTNVASCTSTDDVIVTVNTLPVVNAGVDQTVCEGDAVTLSGTVAGGAWSGPVAVTNGTAFTPPAGIHTFTYSVTNVASCTNTDDVIVTVNALPVVNAGTDQTICEGEAVTLSGTVAGGTWSGPVAVTNGTAFTPPAGVHTFTYSVTNVASCTSTDDVVVTVNTLPTADAGADQTVCEGEAVTLSGSPAAGTWTGPVTIADGVAFTPPAGIHTFTYSVTNAASCTNTDDVIVTVNALPTADAGADLAVCDGEEVTFNGTGGTSPTWTGPVAVTNGTPVVLPVGIHIFNLTITGSNGCTDTDAIQVTVNSLPTAVATDNLDATITASTGTTYKWIDCATNLPIAGATAQTYTVTANGSYAVIVNNGTCEDTSDCVVIDYIGINEVSQDMISVFPNPTRDFVTVNMTAANASIEVVDAQGKILQTSIVENGGTLSLASYETGMYIFRITTENGTSIHRISKN